MSTGRLTTELTSLIISQLIAPEQPTSSILDTAPVAKYAVVSKEWQAGIERHTFSNLRLTPSRLTDFGRIVRGVRKGYVCSIDLDVVLPPYSKAEYGKFENDEDQARNNQSFSRTVQSLFNTLQSWTQDEVKSQGIRLSVKFYSPSDLFRLSQDERRARVQKRSLGGPKDIFDLRYDQSYLRFIPLKTEAGEEILLESVYVITEIRVEPGDLRHMWPASCSQIAAKLPRLRSFNAYLWDSEKKDLRLRKSARNEFAKSILTWPASIQDLDLSYCNIPPRDETFSPPNILSGLNQDQDLLSMNLCHFSQQLTTLRLDMVTVSPSLFWPLPSTTEEDANPTLPQWPHLTSLTLIYNIATPSGEWLFERSPAMDWEDERGEDPAMSTPEDELPAPEDRYPNSFRFAPRPELLNTFYRAAGLAAQNMPRLREMWLGVDQGTSVSHWFEYQWEGEKLGATATWGSTPAFEPEGGVVEVWKGLGGGARGEVKVNFVEGIEGGFNPALGMVV